MLLHLTAFLRSDVTGDGMVHSLKFQGLDKPPVYSSKYIRTSGFKEEDRLGRGKFWPGVKMEPVSQTLRPRKEEGNYEVKKSDLRLRICALASYGLLPESLPFPAVDIGLECVRALDCLEHADERKACDARPFDFLSSSRSPLSMVLLRPCRMMTLRAGKTTGKRLCQVSF
jgi:hypothetical protein